MNTQPLISVCINCYNAENTIDATLRSVLAQTYTNLQVIVVDDCSTDGTWDYLQTITDPRVECHRLAQNGHISNANNEALRRARGEFVAHLDSDDTWYPDKLARQLAFLQEHEEYGACFTLAEMVDENGAPVEDHRFRAENRKQAPMLYHLLTVGNYICHSSMLARREIIEQVGEHDVTLLYFHDYDYWIRMTMVCEFYILPDKLLDYRLSTGSNSAMTEQKKMVHVYEFARIIYQSVLACPDSLFLEAFAERLRLQGAHTPAQTELEKAFILCNMIVYLPQNRALGLRRLSELLADVHYAAVAREDFGFTVHDLYKLEEAAVFHDEAAQAQTGHLIANLRDRIDALDTHRHQCEARIDQLTDERSHILEHNRQLQEAHDYLSGLTASLQRETVALSERASHAEAAHAEAVTIIEALNAHIHAVEAAHAEAVGTIESLRNTLSWRLTKPLRAVRKLCRLLHSRVGNTDTRNVMLYGYFGHNLGDDLFFDRLFTRYPDTAFTVYDAVGYESVFARYPNVRVHQKPAENAEEFETQLLSKTDAVVHIGGSIYQQIGSWEEDLRLREKRYNRRRPFFSISSNFGPFFTEDYRAFWYKKFAISKDICFRDALSFNLFSALPSVRYAPDLLFAEPLPAAEVIHDQLFVSVIDPTHASHPFPEAQCRGYLDTISAVVRQWLESGKHVVLSSFCAFENDPAAVDAIVRAVPDDLRGGLSVMNYNGNGNTAPVLTAIAQSDYVLSTRFHASVFGLSAGKKVLPVCYNQKVSHMLDDIGFDGSRLAMEHFETLTADEIVDMLKAATPFDVRAQKEQAITQFAKLDAFIRQKGGAVS